VAPRSALIMAWFSTKKRVLFEAIATGDSEAVKRALEAGGKPDALQDGESAVLKAATAGRFDILEALISAGADVNRPTSGEAERTGGHGRTPLIAAAEGGHLGCVSALLKAGAHVDARMMHDDESWMSALSAAALNRHLHVVKMLLARGASAVGNPQDRPLWYAVKGGDVEVIMALVEAGADANATIERMMGNSFVHLSPMAVAFDRKDNEIIEMLERARAVATYPDLMHLYGGAIDSVLQASCPRCGSKGWELYSVRVRFDSSGPFFHPSTRFRCPACGATGTIAELRGAA